MTLPPVTALVPMRKHSERLPGKNLRSFCGRPLFTWIVETLGRSRFIGEVLVNTDSEEIAQGVEELGARVLWRPEWLRGKLIDARPLTAYDLDHSPADYFLQTHCTNPLLRTETVDDAIQTFFEPGSHDCLFSVTAHHARFYWPDGRPLNHDPGSLDRTQDLPPILEDNSCMYVFSRTMHEEFGYRIGREPIMFPMDPLESVDIDEESDFTLAEALMRLRLEQEAALRSGRL